MRQFRIGIAAALAGALTWAAPAHGQRSDGTPRGGERQQQGQQAQPPHAIAGEEPVGKDLQKALQKLHAANQTEIEIGEAAQRRAESDQVRQLARRLVETHRQSDGRLQQVAQRLGVDLRGEEFQRTQKESRGTLDELKQKQSAEFDRAYMAFLVKEHEREVKEVHDAAVKAAREPHPQLAELFAQAEAMLHQHHAMAQELHRELREQGAKGAARRGTSAERRPAPGEPQGTAAGERPERRSGDR
jgi:putative membrane protein